MTSGEEPGTTSGEEPTAAAAYDELAAEYVREIESNLYNAELEFPATTALVPDAAGTRVLDAGCGAGRYAEWLLDEGTEVVGVDASEAMLERAAERVGERAELREANLAEPLDFAADGEFDGVVSSLALDYVADWRPTFAEFARVLAPGGFLVFSVRHPLDELDDEANYFEVERRVADWAVEVPYYRRSLSEILGPLLDAGFRMDEVVEPTPTETFRERWPERYETESKRPVFLCVRAVKRE
ncbi:MULTISPECIES: class I SAM-dependent methyltransferase [Halorussus]|uniref:class I SAM-dependent methyltransferase n=1 Tax=Halorussus TaxID=1070314 RepID=UPI00209F318F|nr:class I SAM-dependent methyltransferase [Halorussus vallis]USZ76809.1 methyltransferase domain-containing protein [Halorussus vallis]